MCCFSFSFYWSIGLPSSLTNLRTAFSFSSEKSEVRKPKKIIRVHGCITGNSVGHQNFLSPRVLRSFFFVSSFFPLALVLSTTPKFPLPKTGQLRRASGIKGSPSCPLDIHTLADQIFLSKCTTFYTLRVCCPTSRRNPAHKRPTLLLSSSSNGRRIMKKSCSSLLVSKVRRQASGVYSDLLCFCGYLFHSPWTEWKTSKAVRPWWSSTTIGCQDWFNSPLLSLYI